MQNSNQNQQNQIRNQNKIDEAKQFRKNISLNTFMVVPFMSLNFYDVVFFAIYMIITIGLFLYKVQKYPFPAYAVSMQSVFLTFFALSHYIRYELGKQGVIQKESKQIIFYLIISILMIPLYVFQLRLQTYVALTDYVLNWIGLSFNIAEIICAIWVVVIYKRKQSSI